MRRKGRGRTPAASPSYTNGDHDDPFRKSSQTRPQRPTGANLPSIRDQSFTEFGSGTPLRSHCPESAQARGVAGSSGVAGPPGARTLARLLSFSELSEVHPHITKMTAIGEGMGTNQSEIASARKPLKPGRAF